MDIQLLQSFVSSGLSLYDISKRTGKSVTTVRHHLRKAGLKTVISQRRDEERRTGVLLCLKHGQSFHYFDKNGHKKCRSCVTEATNRRRIKVKKMAVDHKGGACERCGYNKCISALEFHHYDPAQKDFGPSAGIFFGWERVKKEIEKCFLLCANCHREEHERIRLVSSAA